MRIGGTGKLKFFINNVIEKIIVHKNHGINVINNICNVLLKKQEFFLL